MAPIISVFNGITVSINYRDHNPPHIHVQYGEFKAIYNIKTGERINGNLPTEQHKIVVKWARQNLQKLLKNWELASNGKQTFKIRGGI